MGLRRNLQILDEKPSKNRQNLLLSLRFRLISAHLFASFPRPRFCHRHRAKLTNGGKDVDLGQHFSAFSVDCSQQNSSPCSRKTNRPTRWKNSSKPQPIRLPEQILWQNPSKMCRNVRLCTRKEHRNMTNQPHR